MSESYPNATLSYLALPPSESDMEDFCNLIKSRALSRQLMNTQVFRLPNPFRLEKKPRIIYQSRYSHIQTIRQIAGTFAYELGFNIIVTDTGALGHDLGHMAKGHLGEKWVEERFSRKFRHEHFALVVLEKLENLKLSVPVKQCIAHHSWSSDVLTNQNLPECVRAVSVADKFYLIFDVYDTIEILKVDCKLLPYNRKESKLLIDELETLIRAFYPNYYQIDSLTSGVYASTNASWETAHFLEKCVIKESLEQGRISFSESAEAKSYAKLREVMFEKIYHKADNKELDYEELDRVYCYVEKVFPEYDSRLVTLLVDDIQVRELNLAFETMDTETLYDLNFDIYKIILENNLPKKGEPQIDIFAQPNI